MKNFPVLNPIDGQYVSKDEVLFLIAKECTRLEYKINQKHLPFVNLLNQIKAVDKKVDDKTGPLMEM